MVANAASTLLEELESDPAVAPPVVIAAFTALRAASTLEEEFEIEFELTFIAASAASTLDDELDRLRLEVRAVVIAEFVVVKAASTLEEELESVRELVC